MTINPVFHAQSKHVEMDYHFIREQVALGLLVTYHVPSANQVTNIFTKAVPKASLAYFHKKLCLQPQTNLEGDISNSLVQPQQQSGELNSSHKLWGDKEDLWSNKGDGLWSDKGDHTHEISKETWLVIRTFKSNKFLCKW